MATTVTSPIAGTITIHETVATEDAPSGITFVDLQAAVTGPAASAAAPLRLVFRLDASSLPIGLLIDALQVYREGVLVADCNLVPPDALDVDPCVNNRVLLPDGDAQVEVWTSAASRWNFGYPNCEGLADGTPCDDENACTQTDTCQSDVCVGANPVVCTALDQCHDVGTCNSSTGVCSDPAKANGATCDDDNACTQTDTCQAGSCTGTNPVVCTALDQCHDVGVCDAETGICSSPVKEDGTTCDDGHLCTAPDSCAGGECGGTPIATCCENNGMCSDGDVCTSDFCPTGANESALEFDGTTDYVTMGAAAGESALGARKFTIETWFKWTGSGVTVSTGTGGINALIPLVAKGARTGGKSS